MENGRWDEANQEKVRLEEKQRAARRVREELANKANIFMCYNNPTANRVKFVQVSLGVPPLGTMQKGDFTPCCQQ